MKAIICALALLLVFAGVACLDITPYPVLDAGAGEESPDADIDADSTDGGGDG